MSQTDIAAEDESALSSPPLPRAPLIANGETVAVIGTGFAADLADRLGRTVKRIRTEQMHIALEGIPPEAEEYERFSAAYGEVRSARQFRQLLTRCNRTFRPVEDRRSQGGRFVDPFRPRLRYPALSPQEFDVLHERHMNATRAAFRRADVVLLALSVSEVYEMLADGAVLPARPTDADPALYRARTLDVVETIADLAAAVDALRMINPAIRVILMIAPETLAETAAPVHPLVADSYGKAVLRFAMDTAARAPGVSYFPAMELFAAAGGYGHGNGACSAEAIESVARALIELPFDSAEEAGGSPALIPTAPAPQAVTPEPEPEIEAENLAEPAPESITGALRATPLDPYPDAGKSRLRQRRARPAGQPREPALRLPAQNEDAPAPKARRPRKRTNEATDLDLAVASGDTSPRPISAPTPALAPMTTPAPLPRPDRRPPDGMFPRRPQGTLEERKAEKARRLAEFAKRAAVPAEPLSPTPIPPAAAAGPATLSTPEE